jgi:hypothetical protein
MARPSRLNLPPFGYRRGPPPTDQQIPLGMPELFARTITDWSRGLDSTMATAFTAPYLPQLTAVTADPNLGADGTAEGLFTRIGDLVHYEFRFEFIGAGIAQGSGIYLISTPTPVDTIQTSVHTSLGMVTVLDASVGTRRFVTRNAVTALALRPINATAYAADADVTDATVGLTFAAGDTISGAVTYLAAD